MSNQVLKLAEDLIKRRSVTPEDAGCQNVIAKHLAGCGFDYEVLPFGEVTNLWATHGQEEPLLVFAGHTDVVPPGPHSDWHSDPFEPSLRDGMLYGRGAADMKGSLAAMVVAAERFAVSHPDHVGTLAFLITSDEEGAAVDGTVKVMDTLIRRGQSITWCIIGEPCSEKTLGDVIKNGRRGSLNGVLMVKGQQGHAAYPQHADNPIHKAVPILDSLAGITWDHGSKHYPPTSFQITNIESGTGAENVIPGRLRAWFNFRFSNQWNATELQERVREIIEQHTEDYELYWHLSGEPFLTEEGELITVAKEAVRKVTGTEPTLSTGGGTSDGRFIAPTGAQVLELGPVNTTAHKVDEHVQAEDLDHLSEIYYQIMIALLG